VLNLNYYNDWWADYSAVVDSINKTIKFRPFPFVYVTLILTRVSSGKIEFSYIKGPLRGIGYWEIVASNDNCTKISYFIELKTKWKLLAPILTTPLFKRKHTRDILNLISRLEST
jgi:ribosome-associated toxin RatA of RatAB toxin-antitoxin module